MCGEVFSSSVLNPCNPCEPLFIIFDPVHLLKSIKNNLNLKKPIQTFVMHSPADYNSIKKAIMLQLKQIFTGSK